MYVENKDILITDPCYIIKEDSDDDWEKCEYGDDMSNLGFTNYIVKDNHVGDWKFEIYNTLTNDKLGEYCADTGQFGVFELDEVRKYNPEIDAWIKKHSWCATVIPNFSGEIQAIIGDEDACVPKGIGTVNFEGKIV